MSFKSTSSLLAAAVAVLAAGTASAQAIAVGTPGATGTPATVEIEFTGTLQSAVQLTVAADAGTTFTSADQLTTPGVTANALVDFGTFNTVDGTGLATGDFVRLASENAAVVSASFIATITYNGVASGTGSIEVSDLVTDAVIDPAAGDVRVAVGSTNPDWSTGSGQYSNVNGTPTAIVNNAASGQSVPHQIGLYLQDSESGSFSTTVTYTATAG